MKLGFASQGFKPKNQNQCFTEIEAQSTEERNFHPEGRENRLKIGEISNQPKAKPGFEGQMLKPTSCAS